MIDVSVYKQRTHNMKVVVAHVLPWGYHTKRLLFDITASMSRL